MRLFRLACYGFTGLLLLQSWGLADCNCGKCGSSRHDRGLLDVMDQAWSGLLANTKQRFARRFQNRSHCQQCDRAAGPDCGCEQQATCGCEITPGCTDHCGCSPSVSPPAPVITPNQQVWPAPNHQPPVQKHMAPRPTAPPIPDRMPIPIPDSPTSIPSQPEKLPDEQVDPFLDDTVNRIRRPAASSARYLQERAHYREDRSQYRRDRSPYLESRSRSRDFDRRFDPQASHRTAPPPPVPRPVQRRRSTAASGQGFALHSSSRPDRSNTARQPTPPTVESTRQPDVIPESVMPAAVIPASRVQPLRTSSRSEFEHRNDSQSAVINPLRR